MGVVVAARHTRARTARRAQVAAARVARATRTSVARFLREARAAARAVGASTSRACSTSARSTTARPTWSWSTSRARDLAASSRERRAAARRTRRSTTCSRPARRIAEAHALGIVHRDLKPANLFLTRAARRRAARQGARLRHLEDRATRRSVSAHADARAMLGSPLYMSPEQMRSASDVDARSGHLGARRDPLRAARRGNRPSRARTFPRSSRRSSPIRPRRCARAGPRCRRRSRRRS